MHRITRTQGRSRSKSANAPHGSNDDSQIVDLFALIHESNCLVLVGLGVEFKFPSAVLGYLREHEGKVSSALVEEKRTPASTYCLDWEDDAVLLFLSRLGFLLEVQQQLLRCSVERLEESE